MGVFGTRPPLTSPLSYLLTTSSKPRAPKWRGIHQLPTLRDDVISERQLPGGLLLTADMDQNHGDGKVACNTAEEEKNNTASTTRGCEKSCACLKSLFSVDVHLWLFILDSSLWRCNWKAQTCTNSFLKSCAREGELRAIICLYQVTWTCVSELSFHYPGSELLRTFVINTCPFACVKRTHTQNTDIKGPATGRQNPIWGNLQEKGKVSVTALTMRLFQYIFKKSMLGNQYAQVQSPKWFKWNSVWLMLLH